MEANATHWNSFYSSGELRLIPSQFAVFVANEFPQAELLVDIGCGNGRDSMFFAQHFRSVLGIDASEAAIDHNTTAIQNRGFKNAHFIKASVEDEALISIIQQKTVSSLFSVLYARFFVHAIDDDREISLLNLASRILQANQGVFCAEFRTVRDQQLQKITPEHYRRFVSPPAFIQNAAHYGLSCAYFAEGFGFAKYKDDDAHVARVVLTA